MEQKYQEDFQYSQGPSGDHQQIYRGQRAQAYLIRGMPVPRPLSREQAYRVFKSVGKSMGLNSIGAQTMRKDLCMEIL